MKQAAVRTISRQGNRFEKVQVFDRFRCGKLVDAILLKNDELWLECGQHGSKLQRFPFNVEGNSQCADFRGGENDFQMLDAVSHGQRDAVTLADSEREQTVG